MLLTWSISVVSNVFTTHYWFLVYNYLLASMNDNQNQPPASTSTAVTVTVTFPFRVFSFESILSFCILFYTLPAVQLRQIQSPNVVQYHIRMAHLCVEATFGGNSDFLPGVKGPLLLPGQFLVGPDPREEASLACNRHHFPHNLVSQSGP